MGPEHEAELKKMQFEFLIFRLIEASSPSAADFLNFILVLQLSVQPLKESSATHYIL